MRFFGFLFSSSNNCFNIFVWVGAFSASSVLVFWLWGVGVARGFLLVWSECSIFWSDRRLPCTGFFSCFGDCGGGGGDVGPSNPKENP